MRVARAAALAGHPVILAPIKPTYFDYAQSDSPDEPLSIGGPVTLEDVESWEPIPDDWDDAERCKVLGVQGQLWTEFIPDARALDYMLYPRALALAAVAWETQGADTGDRRRRLDAQLPCLAAAGIEYRPAAGVPPWLAGGTGWRKHVNRVPLQHILDVHERAALEGRIPTEDEYDAPLQ
jgi:hexosaminidase